MLYPILVPSLLLHGAFGPFDEILMLVLCLGGWGFVLYYFLKARKQNTEGDKDHPHDLKARKQGLEDDKEHQPEGQRPRG